MNKEVAVISPLSTETVSYQSKADLLMQSFVGEKYQHYYQRKFSKIATKNLIYGFNICAFLFSAVWLYYRKMYLYGTIMVSLLIGMLMLEHLYGFQGQGVLIALSAVTGLVGNGLYKNFAEKKIAGLRRRNVPQLQVAVQQAGGTNLGLALVLLTLFFVVSFVHTLMWR